MIISCESREYRNVYGAERFNGAFWYSKELIRNIIPNVKTDRNWITIRCGNLCYDHSIYFIHNNLNPERYSFLKDYDDVILVCGIPETCERVAEFGTPIYVPLSIDVDYVKKFATEKTKGTCYAGRASKAKGIFKPKTVRLQNIPRDILLSEVAKYEECYAVGRMALEAKALGCKILPYDERFPDPERWQVLDNSEAVKMLQVELDRLDGDKE